MELTPKNIENKILENYIEYQYLFLEFQSKFLSDLFLRYQGIENGNIVLYYARQVHQDILRKKDYDLNFNLSYEKFWKNHNEIVPKKKSIIKIATDTSLPKETARRKILLLTKLKVLNKKNKNTGWLPNEQYKINYNLLIKTEITNVSKLIDFVCKKINIFLPKEEVEKEIKEKFSFYWFHYLGAQLEYLKLWSKQFNDLELVFIFLQVAHLFSAKAKKKNLSHYEIHNESSALKEFISASISATSVSEVTGIPRATCVRKLEILVKLNVIEQDNNSRRYYFIPSGLADNLVSQKITKKVVKIFSNFFFICIRAINART
jgi:hypothetical protein